MVLVDACPAGGATTITTCWRMASWSAAFKVPVPPQNRPWMWASGHNGHIRRAAHGYEPTREAAMAAFGKSWRREASHGKRLVPAREPIERGRPIQNG